MDIKANTTIVIISYVFNDFQLTSVINSYVTAAAYHQW